VTLIANDTNIAFFILKTKSVFWKIHLEEVGWLGGCAKGIPLGEGCAIRNTNLKK
jgi:hypothetical protein